MNNSDYVFIISLVCLAGGLALFLWYAFSMYEVIENHRKFLKKFNKQCMNSIKLKKEEYKVPVRSWSSILEEGAQKQIDNIAQLPFAFHHIAVMPDCHQGYGMPIGGVLATKGVIIPNAVGVDIGCGMCAVKTSLTEINTDTLKEIMSDIRKIIPVGRNKHEEKQDEDLMPDNQDFAYSECLNEKKFAVVHQQYGNALKSLGTLGGGNHFIEIQKGSDEHIWIMIHSGSRNLGLKVAEYYSKLAYDLNKKWYSNTYLPKNWRDSLAFLTIDSQEGKAYIREMNYCVEFALANRELMMNRVKGIVSYFISESISYDEIINIAHNYAKMENHFNQNVMVHRKGATMASSKTVGIIPGSQGAKSYIVQGKGNAESFKSCSHGAGRTMGRKDAIRRLSLKDEIKKLNKLGVIHGVRNQSDLDEAPGAYKDITQVMKSQDDLVDILVELTPLAVIKS